jgi:hypothetical protein
MASYTIWIPFEYPPQRGLSLDEDIEFEVIGYRGLLTKQLRHVGLAITDLPSEPIAQAVLRHVGTALLWMSVAQLGAMSIELEPVELQCSADDPILYWNPFPDSPFADKVHPFDASRPSARSRWCVAARWSSSAPGWTRA